MQTALDNSRAVFQYFSPRGDEVSETGGSGGQFIFISHFLANTPPLDYNITMNDNWGILGHEWAVDLLKGHISRGTPRHAYLFAGPRGVGRRTLALRFAQAINAENPSTPGDFDPQSKTSLQFERMQHPDLSLV